MSDERYKNFVHDFSSCDIWCSCGKPMKLRDSYREIKPPENCYFFVCEECASKSTNRCEKV